MTERGGSVGRVFDSGSRDPGSTLSQGVIFRNNLGQVVNLHLFRSTKPFIPTDSIKLVPASAGCTCGASEYEAVRVTIH